MSDDRQVARTVDAIVRVLRRADRTFVRNLRGIVAAVVERYPYVVVRGRGAAKRGAGRRGGAQ